MKVTAWNNGQHSKSGAGYGIKLSIEDRNRGFDSSWGTVIIDLEGGGSSRPNIAPSFWSDSCREIIHIKIGKWMLAKGLAPWPKGRPPKLQLIPAGKARFKLGRGS